MAVPHSQQATTACTCESAAAWRQLPATRDVVLVADDAIQAIHFNVVRRSTVKAFLRNETSSTAPSAHSGIIK